MSKAEDPAMSRRPSTAMFAFAAVALFAQVPADRGTAEELYTRVRPVRQLVQDEPDDVDLPVIPRDRRLRGNVFKHLEADGDRGSDFYWIVPLISDDGKLAFFLETSTETEVRTTTAVLYDIDKSASVWERILFVSGECTGQGPACEERVNLRMQAINTELASYGWVWPELWNGPDPTVSPQCACGGSGRFSGLREAVWPEIKVTFESPRLLVVAANGRVVVDKHFPAYASPNPLPTLVPCEESNFPELWETGFDHERRVFFITFNYCNDYCGDPKRIIHIFRTPKL